MDDYSSFPDESETEAPDQLTSNSIGPASSGAMFYEIWLLALTRPREDTFQTIVDDPAARVGRAALWIFITSLLSYGIATAIQFGQMAALFNQMEETGIPLGAMAGGGVIALICGLPLVASFAVVGAMIYAAILQFIAGALGGEGSFRQLFFGTASFSAPITVITTGLSLIPFVGACLTIPVSLYAAYLNVLVLKAVNRFGWGMAIIALFVPFIFFILIGLILAALLFPMLSELVPSDVGTF